MGYEGKVAGDLIASADWNAFVLSFNNHSGANTHITGNTVLMGTDSYIKYDTTNETYDFFTNDIQIAELGSQGNFRIRGEVRVLQSF